MSFTEQISMPLTEKISAPKLKVRVPKKDFKVKIDHKVHHEHAFFDKSFPRTQKFQNTCYEVKCKTNADGKKVTIADEYKLAKIQLCRTEFKAWAKVILEASAAALENRPE